MEYSVEAASISTLNFMVNCLGWEDCFPKGVIQLQRNSNNKLVIFVSVFPSFSKTPDDVTVRAGTTARLECAAQGYPAPQIAWQKDGGDDFPAARERRMHIMPNDDVFFIVNVKSSDQGVYSCTATNEAGTVVANATVNVLGEVLWKLLCRINV